MELWDSVEPQAMAQVVAAAGGPLTLTGVATVVDPALVLPYLSHGDDFADAGLAAASTDRRTIADTFARQVEYPTVIACMEETCPGECGGGADDTDRALLARPAERCLAASMDWHAELGDRCQYLTFTSPGLDREVLASLLDSCLLTDEEYAAGRDHWRELPCPFSDLLDPVTRARDWERGP